MEKYIKYYWLEKYLFEEVSKNFKDNHCLTDKEFFAIIIWKRNTSKTRIKDSLIKNDRDIKSITEELSKKTLAGLEKLQLLTDIEQINISFASAILTVCYPDDFTIADYRADNTIKKLGETNKKWEKIIENTNENITIGNTSHRKYFRYLEICKKIANKEGVSLRDFDRFLWAYDFYEGERGLKELVSKYSNKQLESIKIKE